MGRHGIQQEATGNWCVDYVADELLYKSVINFINALPTPDGKPFQLLPWQKTFIKNVFKTRRGKRVVRTAVLSCGRKNGKTGLASNIVLAYLVGPLSASAQE